METIRADEPVLYYKMDERKGAREGLNKGTSGKEFVALYAGVQLWLPGPLKSDPYSRAVGFDADVTSHVDVPSTRKSCRKPLRSTTPSSCSPN